MSVAEYIDPEPPLTPPFAPTIPAMLHWAAERYQDREAQVQGAQRMSFRQLETRSAEMARMLLARGVGKASRLALLMPNGPDFTVAFMAAARAGALVVPLSTLYKPRELSWVLGAADIQHLIVAPRHMGHDYLARLEEAFPELPNQSAGRLALPQAPYLRSILVAADAEKVWAETIDAALVRTKAERPELDGRLLASVEANIVPSDELCVIYTSGSSAEPKGVVHTHGAFLRHSWQKSQRFWGVGEDGDRLIGPRPQFWVAGLAATLMQILITGCTLLDPDDTTAAGVIRLIETEGATGACGNGLWLRALRGDPAMEAAGYEIIMTAHECAAFAKRTPEGLRFLNPARAAKSPSPSQAPLERLPSTYGMTESLAGHTSIPAGELLSPERAGYCGRPMPGLRLRIVDPATGRPVAPGEVGEIQIAGLPVADRLYKRERAATFTPDGFYPSGDLGVMDAEGYVKFHSRTGDVFKVHGANVAPLEVENCLNALPGIIRSAVVGIPDGEGGNELWAAVEMRPGHPFDEDEMRAALKRGLSSFKVPKRIFALQAQDFPLTASGKVRKPPLAEMLRDLR